jgi:hypothetical protein
MAIWCVCFCDLPWRAIGMLCEIPFGMVYGLVARWTRLGLWRRMLDQLRRTWRRACRDSPEPDPRYLSPPPQGASAKTAGATAAQSTTVLARRAVWRGGATMAYPTEQPLVVIRPSSNS